MTKFTTLGLRDVPTLFAIGLALCLIGLATNQFFLSLGIQIPTMRPNIGFGVGALVLAGIRFWPAILVGSFLSRLLIGFSLVSSSANAVGVVTGCVLGCWLLNRDTRFDPSLPSLSDFFRLVLWAGIVGASISALIAAIAMVEEAAAGHQYSATLVLKWWMGDILGVILVTSLMLVWRHPPRDWLPIRKLAEVVLYFALSFLVGQTVFLNWFNETLGSVARGYWMFLFVVWGAARLGPQSVALVLVMTAIQALTGAARGLGFFGTDIAQTQLLNFWFYMVILSIAGIGLASSMTEIVRAEKRVRKLSQHDALTGLANTRLLNEHLHMALAMAKRQGHSVALIFHDLDSFKPVNDCYGHKMGDLLLQAVAARVQECVRETDTVARVGGDEFVILMPSILERKDVLVVAEKIRNALLQPFDVGSHTVNISTSIGIAIYPEHGDTEESLLVNADNAMYFAKMNGRNNVQLFSAEMATKRQGKEQRRQLA